MDPRDDVLGLDLAKVNPPPPRKGNPRFRRQRTPPTAVPVHDPTYGNRFPVFPRGDETTREPEFLAEEKHQLCLSIRKLETEIGELRAAVKEKEKNELLDEPNKQVDPVGSAPWRRTLSAKVEYFLRELDSLDGDQRFFKGLYCRSNRRELRTVALEQRAAMAACEQETENNYSKRLLRRITHCITRNSHRRKRYTMSKLGFLTTFTGDMNIPRKTF
jgi:hypothetical protein